MSLSIHSVLNPCRSLYFSRKSQLPPVPPKLWTDTIDAHRRAVRDATLDATAELIAKHGLAAVTMSQIAEATGIGRATLYKYFADVEEILVAWHERQLARHLEQLTEARDRAPSGNAERRLHAVLEAFALILHDHHGPPLAAHRTNVVSERLHRQTTHVAHAERQLTYLIRDLLLEGAEKGTFRDDISPDELATYCLHALTAANRLPSKAAVSRLVEVTLSALRAPPTRRR